ncbi:MAG: penicillin-binding transpeptidase domain-containing protein [Bacillota bacterium]
MKKFKEFDSVIQSKEFLRELIELRKNRIFVLMGCVCILFVVLVSRLFQLQIVNGQEYSESITASVSKTVKELAPRGNIYDRYGRPLATNNVAYSVQLNNSISLDLTNYRKDLVTEVMDELWLLGQSPVDTLPISQSGVFLFEGEDDKIKKEAELAWKEKAGLGKEFDNADGYDTLQALYTLLEAPASYSTLQKRAYVSYYLDLSDLNLVSLILSKRLIEFEETLIDTLAMDKTYPYHFQFSNVRRETEFKESVAMYEEQLAYDSLETLEYLRSFFGLPEGLPNDWVRNVVGIRYSVYMQRYQQYQSVTIATEINDKTLAYIEENQDLFLNLEIATVSLREYNEGKYFSHIIGYIRQMTAEDYNVFMEDVDSDGNPIYSQTDIVGQAGFERIYETELNGVDGTVLIEVDNRGRVMSTLDSTDPIAGKDIFLTLDAKLQQVTFDSLEKALADAIIAQLISDDKDSISILDLFASMIESNQISAKKLARGETDIEKRIFDSFLRANPDWDIQEEYAYDEIQLYLLDQLATGGLVTRDCLQLAREHGAIAYTDAEFADVSAGRMSVLTLILNKLESGELSPSDTGLDPSTGSVFVTRVDSGEVLASVSYPSYDNNELVNTFNNTYYNDLLEDTNTPLVYRPLKQKKAPGSTFKMIPLLAGLETGTIDLNTQIQDEGIFTKAGTPHARCWIYAGGTHNHGLVDVCSALEVSCNYFLYELMYRMSNEEGSNTEQGITTLNEYMAAFGLNDVSGVELEEYIPTMASPYYKERVVRLYNPDATESQIRWTDGDTIRASIGQSVNSYTPSQMAKYIATLANGGTLYKLHMVSSIKNADGTMYKEIEEETQNITEFQDEYLQAIYQGMYDVAKGSQGTLRTHFREFPMDVAVKTGTAQEDLERSSHTWLVGFAPYDDPQIAISIMIPFGDGNSALAPTVFKDVVREYFGMEDETVTSQQDVESPDLFTTLNP